MKKEVLGDTMEVYTIVFEWIVDGADGIDVEVFDTYEKAVKRFNEIIENEKHEPNGWVDKAFDENGDLLEEDYDLDCNDPFTDGKEHELWWRIRCERDWFLHENLELRILEVK